MSTVDVAPPTEAEAAVLVDSVKRSSSPSLTAISEESSMADSSSIATSLSPSTSILSPSSSGAAEDSLDLTSQNNNNSANSTAKTWFSKGGLAMAVNLFMNPMMLGMKWSLATVDEVTSHHIGSLFDQCVFQFDEVPSKLDNVLSKVNDAFTSVLDHQGGQLKHFQSQFIHRRSMVRVDDLRVRRSPKLVVDQIQPNWLSGSTITQLEQLVQVKLHDTFVDQNWVDNMLENKDTRLQRLGSVNTKHNRTR
ncbi:hypothetical protein WICPIJ_001943 [Wickerhamomyces pijperi]|uniref:Uncharacterized protein n=1 Tax=Wickerhamomyces pijperi TaxID=599730 RepID=A0A9P8QCM7_WICPI|nr:hypothetical protein WICPIJ_001943 [Wickerhamomyces pijperi]